MMMEEEGEEDKKENGSNENFFEVRKKDSLVKNSY